MNVIGRDIRFNINFNPATYRSEISDYLIKNSDSMEDVCLCCFHLINDKNSAINCLQCKRFMHQLRCSNLFNNESSLCKVCESYNDRR